MKLAITHDQAKYLAFGPSADGELADQGTLIISDEKDGWLFVESLDSLGNEGSGVWVDLHGIEHYDGGWPPSTESPIAELPRFAPGIVLQLRRG